MFYYYWEEWRQLSSAVPTYDSRSQFAAPVFTSDVFLSSIAEEALGETPMAADV